MRKVDMIFPALAEWDAQVWLDQVERLGIVVEPYESHIVLRRPGPGIARCLSRSLVKELTNSQMEEIRELVT